MTDLTSLYRPDLWALDPDVVYVNHGGFGAVPRPVLAAQRRWQDQMEANPTRYFRRVVQDALDAARLSLCAFLGAGPMDAAFVTNASSGISAVFASFPLRAGDEIVLTDHGYGSVQYAARRAADRVGGTVTEAHVPLDADDDAVVEAVLGAVTDRTVLAVIDHIASATAKLFPVRRLVPALQRRGVAVLVDAAHAPGSVPVDLRALRPDFWVGNLHKWPCAPRGTALLYAAPRWRAGLRAQTVSWRDPEGFPHAFTNAATVDQSAWLAAPAALEFFAGFGWPAVRERNNLLAARGQALVAEAIGADLTGMPQADLPMRLVPLAGFRGGPDAGFALRDRIADQHGVETAINVWSGRALLRISAQMYNTDDDYRALGAAVRAHVAAG